MKIANREYPRMIAWLTRPGFQTIFALLALCLIVAFDGSTFVFRPYDGLLLGSYDMTVVLSLDPGGPAEKAGLLPGDKLLAIDGRPVDRWLSQPMYRPGIQAGEAVIYQLLRNGQILTIPAVMGGYFDNLLFFGPVLGLQALSLVFWLIGLSLCLFAPAEDIRARLAGLVWLLTGIAVAVMVALPAASLRDQANRWVSRALYGACYDHASVAGGLSSRLAQALDRAALILLLTEDLARQMGIQQTALLLIDGDSLAWRPVGGEAFVAPLDDRLCQTLLGAQSTVRAQNLWALLPEASQIRWQRFAWGELFVPIIFEDRLQGLHILGSRVASDLYSDQDMHILATVAHQGALALANIQLVETLRGLSQQLVRAGEEERKQLARELHDGVLQNLFFIKQKLRQETELVGHLDDVITTLRRTIRAQRPQALDRGLAPALQDLVADMRKIAGEDGPQIVWQNQTGDMNVPDRQAIAIYRIAQEAISNAIRHARANCVSVKLTRDNGKLGLVIEDDGVGMPPALPLEGHYGLIGMRERAIMIGASLRIVSNRREGTRVVMAYKPC